MEIKSYLLGKKAGGGGSTPTLQNKSVEITENGTTNVTADSGYDGLSEVEVTTNVSSGGIDEYFSDTVNLSNGNNPLIKGLVKKIPPITLGTQRTELTSSFATCIELISAPQILNMEQVTKTSSMFGQCYKLVDVPNYNSVNVTNMSSMFSECTSLITAPQLNTSHATDLSYMFAYCSQLRNVPQYNLSSATNLTNMFRNCANITDEGIDNVLISCTTASSYTGTKTLRTIGFNNSSVYPVSRIQTLSHYQDFLDAGWTVE